MANNKMSDLTFAYSPSGPESQDKHDHHENHGEHEEHQNNRVQETPLQQEIQHLVEQKQISAEKKELETDVLARAKEHLKY